LTILALAVPNARAVDVNPAVVEAENQRIAVMDRAKNAVLAVFSPSGQGGGSGVVISPDGYALTNFHVVQPCGNWMRCGMADGKLYDAVLAGLDPTGDVALVKLFGRDDFPAAELGDSDEVRPGDWAFAMGNPFLLATDFQPTVTYGIISGTHRYQYPAGTLLEYTDCLQTDAAVNPGNSGGPLFDARGRLIGINGRCSFEKRGRVSVGVGYAISLNQIKNFLGCLRSGRVVDHATLGARVAFDGEGRVIVDEILPSSDAYRRGLRYGDEIVEFAGRAISTPNGFKNVLGIFPKGWRLPLSYRREGKRFDVSVRLQGVHREGELLSKIEGRPPIPLPEPEPKPQPDKPQPGKKPEGEAPKDLKDLPKKLRELMPGTKAPGASPMPKVVHEHFQKRRGYANYYYNRQNQDRVWQGWTAEGNFAVAPPSSAAAPRPAWTLAGQTEGGQPFRFVLDDQGATIDLPGGQLAWTAGDALGSNLLPPQSGGLVVALHLWRRLAVEGLDRFGEVYYLGTAPLAGEDKPVDVLVGLDGGVECRFFFDPEDHRLLAIEMVPDDESDPCEVGFGEYHVVEGRLVPGRMEVRVGNDRYGVFLIEKLTTSAVKP
jgi:S1-C subfamily serine protease